MKKYAVLIAALMVIQGGARADHLRCTCSDSRPGAFTWSGKADSSIRGAITPYSSQHMYMEPNAPTVTIAEEPRIRADSSQRGAKMPEQTWENRSSSSDTTYNQGEQGVAIDNEPLFRPDVQIPAQGGPGENVQSEQQSSDLFDTPTRLEESDINSDYHPQYPEQGAPATSPETGRDKSLEGEATLQNQERSTESSDLKSAQSYNNSVDRKFGATGVQSPDSVDTTVRPPLTQDLTAQPGTEDLAFRERVRMNLTSGNEGRPGAFTAASLDDVKINSHAGVVTLEGRIGSDQEKRDLESRVKEMPGVLSVNNMLEVTGNTSEFTPPDF